MKRLVILFLSVFTYFNSSAQNFEIVQGSSIAPCLGDSIVLTCTTNPSHIAGTYLWYETISGTILSSDTFCNLFPVPVTPRNITVQVDTGTIGSPVTLFDGIFVNTQALPPLNLGVDTIFCSGDTLTLQDSLFDSNYSYIWSTGVTAPSIQVTETGVYTVRKEAFFTPCIGRDTIVVTRNPGLQLQDQGIFNICQGESLAVSVLFDSAGTSPYQVAWSPASFFSNPTSLNAILTSSVDTIVEINIRDRNGVGCKDSISIPVKMRSQVIPQVAFSDSLICKGDSIVLVASGASGNPGSGGYSFSWSGPNIINPNTSNPTVFPNVQSQYNLIVSDSFDCANPATVIISLDTFQLNIANGDSAFVCSGESAQILVNVIGGDGNETFLWSPDNGGVSDINIAEPLISTQGTYTLIGTSSTGCIKSDVVSVGISVLPEFTFSALDPFYCEKTGIVDLQASASSGVGPYKFIFIHSDTILNKDSADAVSIPANQIGIGGLEQIVGYVIDSKACVSVRDTTIVNIIGAGNLDLRLTSGPFQGEEVTFLLQGAGTADSVFWDFGNGNIILGDTINSNVFDSLGIYLIEARAYILGCEGTDTLSIEVIVEPGENITYIPTAFSINAASQENKSLKLYGNNINSDEFEFLVYSAWGDIIFESSDLTEMTTIGWTGENLESGVYVVRCKGTFKNGEVFSIKQTVNLVR